MLCHLKASEISKYVVTLQEPSSLFGGFTKLLKITMDSPDFKIFRYPFQKAKTCTSTGSSFTPIPLWTSVTTAFQLYLHNLFPISHYFLYTFFLFLFFFNLYFLLLKERRMIDCRRLWAKGGDGGNGCFSFHRSRHDRRGRPDGE